MGMVGMVFELFGAVTWGKEYVLGSHRDTH